MVGFLAFGNTDWTDHSAAVLGSSLMSNNKNFFWF